MVRINIDQYLAGGECKLELSRNGEKIYKDLLSFFGINVAVYSTIDDDVIQLSVPSTSLNSLLIGRNADNLRALQHVVSMALVVREAEVTRVNVDVANYKRQRADRIAEKAEGWIQKVRETIFYANFISDLCGA